MAIVTVFKDKADPPEWRWHKESGDDIIADSGEGYKNKGRAIEMAEREVGPDDELVVENGHDADTAGEADQDSS